MTDVDLPDNVVELAAAERQRYGVEHPGATSVSAMRHALSLPAVREALCRPVPQMGQAERLARDAWMAAFPGDRWEPDEEQARLRAHFQALIDADVIPADPVPDVAEALAEAFMPVMAWGFPVNDEVRAAFRALIAAGWTFIPPSSDTGKAQA